MADSDDDEYVEAMSEDEEGAPQPNGYKTRRGGSEYLFQLSRQQTAAELWCLNKHPHLSFMQHGLDLEKAVVFL